MDQNDSCLLYFCKKCKGILFSKDEFLIHNEGCEGSVEDSDCTHFLCEKKSMLQSQKNESVLDVYNDKTNEVEIHHPGNLNQTKKRKNHTYCKEKAEILPTEQHPNKRPRRAAAQKLLTQWGLCEIAAVKSENTVGSECQNVTLDSHLDLECEEDEGTETVLGAEHCELNELKCEAKNVLHDNNSDLDCGEGTEKVVNTKDSDLNELKCEKFETDICKVSVHQENKEYQSEEYQHAEINETTNLIESDVKIHKLEGKSGEHVNKVVKDRENSVCQEKISSLCLGNGQSPSEKYTEKLNLDYDDKEWYSNQDDIKENGNSDNSNSGITEQLQRCKTNNLSADNVLLTYQEIKKKKVPSKDVLAFLKSCRSKYPKQKTKKETGFSCVINKSNKDCPDENCKVTKDEKLKLKMNYQQYLVESDGEKSENARYEIKGTYQCPKCPYGFKKLGVFHKHMTSAHLKSEENCSAIENDEHSIAVENFDHVNQETSVQDTHKSESNDTVPQTGESTTKISNRQIYNQLRAHWVKLYEDYIILERNVFKEYKCPVCSYTSKRVGHFHRHFVNVHNDAKSAAKGNAVDRWKCEICGFETGKKAIWTQHKKSHEKPYLCEHCPKRFGNKKNLDDHVLVHQGVRPLQCPYCDYVAIQKRCLQEHIRKHTGEMLYCDKCTFTTIYTAAMKMHILAKHTEKKLHPCPDCQYVTNDRTSLQKHMQLHRSHKDFKCSSCSFEGVTKHDVIRHMRCHTQEKVYFCDRCDFSTAYSTAFKNHMMVHFDLKPFKCSVCGYGANQKAKIVTHFRHKHEGVYCGVIDMGVKLKLNLKNYRRAPEVVREYEVFEEIEGLNIGEDKVDVSGIKTVVTSDIDNQDDLDQCQLNEVTRSDLEQKIAEMEMKECNENILPCSINNEHKYADSHPISVRCLTEAAVITTENKVPTASPVTPTVQETSMSVQTAQNSLTSLDPSMPSIKVNCNASETVLPNINSIRPSLQYNLYRVTEGGHLEILQHSDLQGNENVVVLTENGQSQVPVVGREDVVVEAD